MAVGQRRTWMLERFTGGFDLRDGLYSDRQGHFRQLHNCMTTKGGKIRRRWACVATEGELSPLSQGLIAVDGQLYAFAPKQSGAAHTGLVTGTVGMLEFDVPDNCSPSNWELLESAVFDGYAVALIKHALSIPGSIDFIVFLHVWDGLLYAPTFVQDPAFPGSFSPSIGDLAEQAYDGAFRPVLGQGALKLWTSSNRGNAYASRTADPRVWNQRTQTDILERGEEYVFVAPSSPSPTVHTFRIPRDAAWLTRQPSDGPACWVCEREILGSWEVMAEVSGTPFVAYTWSISAVGSRFLGGWNEMEIKVFWPQTTGLIRFRLVHGATAVQVTKDPTIAVVQSEGPGVSFFATFGEAKYRWNDGDEMTRAAFSTAAVMVPPGSGTAPNIYRLAVAADALGYINQFVVSLESPNPTAPLGIERLLTRYRKRVVCPPQFVGRTEFQEGWPQASDVLTGTVSVTGTSITGVGTLFTTEIGVVSGYYDTVLVAAAGQRRIASVGGNLAATVVSAWGGAAGPGLAISRVRAYSRLVGGKTLLKVDATFAAALRVGYHILAGSTPTEYIISALDGQIATVTSAAGADGDYTANLNYLRAVTVLSTHPVVEDYEYAYERPESAWYAERVAEAIDAAGAEDALSLATAAKDNSGGRITAIASVRNRLAIAYPGSTQLWEIDPDTARTALLDVLAFGTGDQPRPTLTPWYGSLLGMLGPAPRALSVVGVNSDSMTELNIGEPIESLGIGETRGAQFWPHTGQWILARNLSGSAGFLCLDYSRESKISAWATWSVTGLPVVDWQGMVVLGDSLWLRSGTLLSRFWASRTEYADAVTGSTDAFTSVAALHFNDMGDPGRGKRFVALDLIQDGRCNLDFLLPPGPPDWSIFQLTGPSLERLTYGRARIPLALVGQAVAPILFSTDPAGWTLHRLAIDFLTVRR